MDGAKRFYGERSVAGLMSIRKEWGEVPPRDPSEAVFAVFQAPSRP